MELDDWIHNFVMERLRFIPDINPNAPWLPFAMQRPFTVYDISKMTDEQIDLLYELAPQALTNCLQPGYQLYSIDWNHSVVLYDPRNPQNHAQSGNISECSYTKSGIAYFNGFYPDGDYMFFLDKYGYFGYLAHPWREEVWIYGENLLAEFEKISTELGWIPKAVLH